MLCGLLFDCSALRDHGTPGMSSVLLPLDTNAAHSLEVSMIFGMSSVLREQNVSRHKVLCMLGAPKKEPGFYAEPFFQKKVL